MEHQRWSSERLFNDWKSGERRDERARISPYMVPWAELPDNVKEQDRVMVRMIPELLSRVGLEIRRQG